MTTEDKKRAALEWFNWQMDHPMCTVPCVEYIKTIRELLQPVPVDAEVMEAALACERAFGTDKPYIHDAPHNFMGMTSQHADTLIRAATKNMGGTGSSAPSHAVLPPPVLGDAVTREDTEWAKTNDTVSSTTSPATSCKSCEGLVKIIEQGYEMSKYAAETKERNTNHYLHGDDNDGLYGKISAFQWEAEKALAEHRKNSGGG